MKDKRNVIGGIALIVLAVCIVLDRLGTYPGLPLLKIGVLAVLVIFFFNALKKMEFFGMGLTVGVAAWLFSSELGIQNVPGYILIIAAGLVGIGLNMIFGKKEHYGWHKVTSNSSAGLGSGHYESSDSFSVDNNMGTKTEYVKITNLKEGRIDNAMGQLTVYLDGTTIDPSGAIIEADNGLGSLKIFIPKELRVQCHTENGLGQINFHGESSTDQTLPVLQLNIENGLGSVEVFFE
ncbi:MAG: hypothetical protein K6F66_05765 [Pseudobutyrivibrio sp.]|nr:hypothetical protein [Pseudobutyrivibrio sp.]